jgi:hypothetical protein
MKRSIVLFIAGLAAVLLLLAQQQQRAPYSTHVPFEMLSVFPRENPPGFYQYVDQRELQTLADQGWELVSVMPFVYRNEERGSNNPKAIVTQTYPAYFFKRAKMIR